MSQWPRAIRAITIDLPWQMPAALAWLTLNAALLLLPLTFTLLVPPLDGIWHDWRIWEQVPERLEAGRLYEPGADYYFVFAPLAAWVLAAIVPLGYPVWWSLHLAVLPLLRDWRLALLALLSVAFWVDTMIGSTTTFVFVAGALAIRGSRWGSLAFLALFLLMPRPVHLPLAAWLVWQRLRARLPFSAMLAVLAFTTLASGYALEWAHELIWVGGTNYSNPGNFSPTRLFGLAWLGVGIPLAAWLTAKGRLGLAGLSLTPYFGPPYLLNLLWELVPSEERRSSTSEPDR